MLSSRIPIFFFNWTRCMLYHRLIRFGVPDWLKAIQYTKMKMETTIRGVQDPSTDTSGDPSASLIAYSFVSLLLWFVLLSLERRVGSSLWHRRIIVHRASARTMRWWPIQIYYHILVLNLRTYAVYLQLTFFILNSFPIFLSIRTHYEWYTRNTYSYIICLTMLDKGQVSLSFLFKLSPRCKVSS